MTTTHCFPLLKRVAAGGKSALLLPRSVIPPQFSAAAAKENNGDDARSAAEIEADGEKPHGREATTTTTATAEEEHGVMSKRNDRRFPLIPQLFAIDVRPLVFHLMHDPLRLACSLVCSQHFISGTCACVYLVFISMKSVRRSANPIERTGGGATKKQ